MWYNQVAMATFQQSLIDIRSDHETRKTEFVEGWEGARRMILRVFQDALGALDGAKIEHENGVSSTLSWRDSHISFKADEYQMKIVRISHGEPDESYDPPALTRDRIEAEVRSFVRSAVVGRRPTGGIIVPGRDY